MTVGKFTSHLAYLDLLSTATFPAPSPFLFPRLVFSFLFPFFLFLPSGTSERTLAKELGSTFDPLYNAPIWDTVFQLLTK